MNDTTEKLKKTRDFLVMHNCGHIDGWVKSDIENRIREIDEKLKKLNEK